MVLGIGTFFSNILVGTNAPVFDNPKDACQMDYENVEFQTDDDITIRGWWIPCENSSKAIVHTHFGLFCCRSGYTPEGKGMMAPSPHKMEFLKAIPHYHKSGYNVLMMDLRGHGDSDPHPGQDHQHFASYGKFEQADVRAAVAFCERRKMDRLYLYGICMGGTSTVMGFPQGLAENLKIKALTHVQPATYAQFTKNMGLPQFLIDMTTAVSNKRLGFSIEQLTFDDALRAVNKPILMIQNSKDPFHRREQVQAMYDLIPAEKKMIWLEDLEASRAAAYYWLCDHPEVITEWFDRYE